ncbi:MAG TPA: SurA N-terminal domain-containing protein [Acetobacteraceae bacterium]|nr:SurA N-terminal domain-containing protein [Acetobacteraceae bacterium]
MIGLFRRFLNTWPARLFFGLLVLAFGLWGIGDVIRNIGHDSALARVGSDRIEVPQFQEAFQHQMTQATRTMGDQQPTPEMRRLIAQRTMQTLLTQAAIGQEVNRLGLVVPDPALRQAVFDIEAFHDKQGHFDRQVFDAVLRNNDMTEARFLDLMRTDLGQRQLLEAVRAGSIAPGELAHQVFDFEQEKRVAALVTLPFAAAPAPPAPGDKALHRYYDNNPDKFSAPEYRRIKAIVLSPATIAKDMTIPAADIQAYYDQNRAQYVTDPTRSLEVIVAPDQATAEKLAAQWQKGADWATMQQAAKAANASATELADATAADIPSPELAKAAFAAQPGTVPAPIKTELGWQVVKVTQAKAGVARSLASVQDAIRATLAQQRAGDQLYDRANKVEDVLASGSGLEKIPDNLGLAAVEGTLDAKGITPEGNQAPIPGPPELRTQLIAAAFDAKPDEPPHLNDVTNGSGETVGYYAVVVEKITPSARIPYDKVADQVREDWLAQQRRHEQETVAAKLMTAVNGGKSLVDAAEVDGLHVDTTPPIGRDNPPPDVPTQLVQPLFVLAKGKATMVETPDGFVVAQLTQVEEPSPTKDPLGYDRIRHALSAAIANDVEVSFAAALRERGNARVNQSLFDQVVGQ